MLFANSGHRPIFFVSATVTGALKIFMPFLFTAMTIVTKSFSKFANSDNCRFTLFEVNFDSHLKRLGIG